LLAGLRKNYPHLYDYNIRDKLISTKFAKAWPGFLIGGKTERPRAGVGFVGGGGAATLPPSARVWGAL